MNIFREGRLRDSDISTGDMLAVQLFREDLEMLTTYRYATACFEQFRHKNLGWDGRDKARIELRAQELHPEDDEKLVTVSLDPGGDIYFLIWETDKLHKANASETFPVEEILDYDPSGKLERLGIVTVKFMGLSALANELYAPKWTLPD